MNLRIYLTEAAFQRAVDERAEDIARNKMARRMRLYASNRTLLRSAIAAFHGVRTASIKDDSVMFDPISAAIIAFATDLELLDQIEALVIQAEAAE